MNVKSIRLILKACAEDTRLRILSLLNGGELTVKAICQILGISQSVISKHLSRLRLLKIVTDRRQGNLVYYRLTNKKGSFEHNLIGFLKTYFKLAEDIQKDIKALKKLRNR